MMARIVAQETKALEELYNQFARPLFGVVYSIVKKKEDAEEILLDVFYRAWEKAATFDGEKGTVWGWLLALARYRAIDKLRSKEYKDRMREDGSEAEMESAGDPQATDPAQRMDMVRRMERIRKALECISPEQRCVLEAAYFEGRSQTQVAEKLGMPLGTVKTRMRDGMRRLQNLLKGMR